MGAAAFFRSRKDTTRGSFGHWYTRVRTKLNRLFFFVLSSIRLIFKIELHAQCLLSTFLTNLIGRIFRNDGRASRLADRCRSIRKLNLIINVNTLQNLRGFLLGVATNSQLSAADVSESMSWHWMPGIKIIKYVIYYAVFHMANNKFICISILNI